MRKSLLVFTCFGLFLGATQAGAQWWDDFNTYRAGAKLSPQSDWEPWNQNAAADAVVVDGSLPPPGHPFLSEESLRIQGETGSIGNDVVYDFNFSIGRPTSGSWVCSADTFVATGASGVGWFIMLNRYTHSGAQDWSLQQQFDANGDLFHPVEPAGTDVPLVRDSWVKFIALIDLDNDRLDVFYNGDQVVDNGIWIDSGDQEIAVIDLYGGEPGSGITNMYYENMALEEGGPGGAMALSIGTNPLSGGDTINLDIWSPTMPSGLFALFYQSINGSPFVSQAFAGSLDFSGHFGISPTMPPGFSGFEIGMRAYAIPAGGGPGAYSNLETVYLQ